MDRTANVRYLYDGTFDGLLCCVYESVYSREVPADICAQAQAQPCLMEDRWIKTDAERAQRVYRSIPKKIAARPPSWCGTCSAPARGTGSG